MTRGPVARRFLLVRHGETEGQSSVRYHGSTDVPLSDLGRSQVRGLLPLVRAFAPVAVVHSPLRRATESAAILAGGSGWDGSLLAVEADLREVCFGDCEGLTAEQIAAAFPAFWQQHQQGRTAAFPGGEDFGAFAARVTAAVARLDRLPPGDLVVVAHRGVVRHALRHLLDAVPGAPDQFGVDLGSLSVVRRGPAPTALESFNVVAPRL